MSTTTCCMCLRNLTRDSRSWLHNAFAHIHSATTCNFRCCGLRTCGCVRVRKSCLATVVGGNLTTIHVALRWQLRWERSILLISDALSWDGCDPAISRLWEYWCFL